MAAATTDLFTKVGLPGSATTLESPGFTIGGTTLNVASTANWQNETLQVFAMDQVTIEAGEEVRIAGSYRECVGIVTSATSIGSFAFASGFSPRNYPAGSTTRVYIPVASTRENMLVDGLKQEHNLNGTHKNITTNTVTASGAISAGGSVTASSFIVSGSQTTAGWLPLGVAQSGTIVHNGNRSYDVPFASSLAAIVSPGMMMLFDKTVAGNGYMGGAFNGTSHYFTKTSPTGALGTVTNNFTLEDTVMLTAYGATNTYFKGRSDATAANGFGLGVDPSGRIVIAVFNGGAANYRIITSAQSVPLNKKIHIAASWASGTGVIYFDGISVPVLAAITGGTAPTTAGTGGDFSIGRLGSVAAGTYASGYISNSAVFDSVLSAATIKQHATYKLLGSETNCIGAWSLDNTAVNQQAPGTNDLTATGGVGYTAMSPHGQLSNGVETTKAIGLVMAVNGPTATVQCPEGVTIPTTGGITSVSYATSGNPFGWVSNKERWSVALNILAAVSTSGTVAGTIYNPGGINLSLPAGDWSLESGIQWQATSNANVFSVSTIVSTSNTAPTTNLVSMAAKSTVAQASTSNAHSMKHITSGSFSASTMTPLYILILNGSAFSSLQVTGSVGGALLEHTHLTATPAGL